MGKIKEQKHETIAFLKVRGQTKNDFLSYIHYML